MASAREMELRESGLSNTEASVLFITQVIEHIHRQPTPTEISRWLYRRPHSISALLNRMAKRGLLRIVTGQGGKNTKRAVLTDKGRQLYEQTSGRASIHNIMSCLAAEDREKLWSSLEKLRDAAVKEVGIKQVMPWPRPR